jgi:hypothetical protein
VKISPETLVNQAEATGFRPDMLESDTETAEYTSTYIGTSDRDQLGTVLVDKRKPVSHGHGTP